MSEENVEIVRRLYEAAARRDTETVLSLYDPDVEWDFSKQLAVRMFGRSTYRGHEGLRAFFRDNFDAFHDFGHVCEEVIDAGEHVVSFGAATGLGRESGLQVDAPRAAVWTIRNGRIVRVVWFESREEALEAAGVRE